MNRPIPPPWPDHWGTEDRLVRNSPYSYACGACSRCCRDKSIQVNPYEIARLARSLALSTSAFIETRLIDVSVRRLEDGTCVFLGERGCTAHADRPLVCRLYPLGRTVARDGQEHFRHAAPHPRTAGHYGESGTVQGWLDAQGAGPFIAAVDAYGAAFHRLFAALAAREGTTGVTDWPDQPAGRTADWLDIDLALGEAKAGESVEARTAAHIEWLGRRAG